MANDLSKGKGLRILLPLVAVLSLTAMFLRSFAPVASPVPEAEAQTATTRLMPSDIAYLGAFRLQENWAPDYNTWEYSNGPIAYYPLGDPTGTGDGFPGSLFSTGHVYASKVAEMKIPAPVNSKNLSSLPTAQIIQPMTDVTAGISNKNGFIMGMTYLPSQDRIYFTHGSDYSDSDCDGSSSPISPPGLGSFKPTLSNPQPQGLWYLSRDGSRMHPFASTRYIMEVPQAWAHTYLQGRALATGRHRGWCDNEGSNLYASAPWLSGNPAPGSNVPASTLMRFGAYTDSSRWGKEHTPANVYQGGAWLTSGSKAAAIVSGLIDYDYTRGYYGYSNYLSAPQCDPTPSAQCLQYGGRGWHQSDPHPAFLFYDPADLAAVAHGTKNSWEVQWYAKFDLAPYMFRTYPDTMLVTGADTEDLLMTFDRARGIIYVSESFADGAKPVIHVFRIAGGGTPIP
jgi:hypothetical protein